MPLGKEDRDQQNKGGIFLPADLAGQGNPLVGNDSVNGSDLLEAATEGVAALLDAAIDPVVKPGNVEQVGLGAVDLLDVDQGVVNHIQGVRGNQARSVAKQAADFIAAGVQQVKGVVGIVQPAADGAKGLALLIGDWNLARAAFLGQVEGVNHWSCSF